jgi:hypothetical protein
MQSSYLAAPVVSESAARESTIKAPQAGGIPRYTSSVGAAARMILLLASQNICCSVENLSFGTTINCVSRDSAGLEEELRRIRSVPSEKTGIIDLRNWVLAA